MLRTLVSSALRLVISATAFIGVALAVGQAQPPSHWRALLQLDACELPCWIGIEPGKTTLEEARRYIEAAYQDRALYQLEVQDYRIYALTYLPTGYRLAISMDTAGFPGMPESIAERIYLQPLRREFLAFERPNIAELYSSLGSAEGVQRLSGINITSLAVLFRNRLVEIYFDEPECDRVDPLQTIRSILISRQSNERNVAWLSTPMRWQGFQRCHDLELRNYP